MTWRTERFAIRCPRWASRGVERQVIESAFTDGVQVEVVRVAALLRASVLVKVRGPADTVGRWCDKWEQAVSVR